MGQINPCGHSKVMPAPIGGFWTSTGTILVLYILLVIILRSSYL